MPVKWTSETDQILLLKILETSSVQVDVKAVSEAWPPIAECVPTPRAISERLFKIRAMAKSSGAAAHFSVSKGGNSNKSTPRKARLSTKNGVKKTNGAQRKRRGKNLENSSESDSDAGGDAEEITSPSLTTRRGAAAAKAVSFSDPVETKTETMDDDLFVGTVDDEDDEMDAEI